VTSSNGRWLITGGIGSGKSAVRELLAKNGIRTIDADAVGHSVLTDEALAPVAERWPGVVGFDGIAAVEMPLLDPGLHWPRMVVDAKDDVRLRRAMRRGMSEAEVRERMAAQPSRARWLSGAALVVPNHGDLEALEVTVDQLIGYLLSAE
jgi:dephospho-CoA kinase